MRVSTVRLRAWLPGCLALLLLGSCDSSTGPKAQVGVSITSPVGPVTLSIGDSVTVVAAVQNATDRGVTYGSSNPAVAAVSPSGVVRARSGGSARITATAVADPRASAALDVVVLPDRPSSLVIETVLNAGGAQPVDPSRVQGLIFVQLALDPGSAARLEILLDTVVVYRESFGSPAGGPSSAGVANPKYPVNTAAVDSATGTPLLYNGPAVLSARLVSADGRLLKTASGQQLTLANPSFLVVRTTASRQAVDAAGLRWYGGDVTATVEPTLFDRGRRISRVDVRYRTPAGATLALADSTAPFGVVFRGDSALAGLTDPEFRLSVTSATEDGAVGPAAVTTPVRLDNQPPEPGRLVPRSWVGAKTPFASTYDAATERDAGVGRTTVRFYVGDPLLDAKSLVAQGRLVERGSDLPRAYLGAYRVAARVCDALENCALREGFTFGVDLNPPSVESVSLEDRALNPGADLVVRLQDDLSGIGAYALEATTLVLRATSSVALCGPVVEGRDLPGKLVGTACVPDSLSFTIPVPRSTAGYYSYAFIPTDQAGNQAEVLTRRVLVDLAPPSVNTVSLPAQLPAGDEVAVQAEGSDNLDLVQLAMRLVYPNETRTGTLALPFAPADTVGAAFDATLTTTAATTRRFYFVRSLTYASGGGAASRATVVVDSLQVRATDAAELSSVASRFLPRSTFGNDSSTTDPFPTLSSVTSAPDRAVVCTEKCTPNDPTSVRVSLRVVDENTATQSLPFARVYFYRRGPDGRVSLLGSPVTTGSTFATGSQRTITYVFDYVPQEKLEGSFTLFAVGVTSRGAGITTEYRPLAGNTVTFFRR